MSLWKTKHEELTEKCTLKSPVPLEVRHNLMETDEIGLHDDRFHPYKQLCANGSGILKSLHPSIELVW